MRLRNIACASLLLVGCLGCGSGSPPPGAKVGPELTQGGVIFHYQDSDAARVCVVGDFNSWTLHADPLVDKHGDGQWSLFFPLRPGRYEYKFVIDGTRWISDPRNPATVPDGFDGVNSLVVVPQPSASP